MYRSIDLYIDLYRSIGLTSKHPPSGIHALPPPLGIVQVTPLSPATLWSLLLEPEPDYQS